MRASRSGSETRQRHKDVRIRLSPEEIATFDAEVARRGFNGQQARGDWLRAQLGLLPLPDPADAASHQRVPVPGGQALLARLGETGTDLRKLVVFLGAYVTDSLPEHDRQRLQADLITWTEKLLKKLDDAITEVAERFADERGRL